jgi:hypothetical protein
MLRRTANQQRSTGRRSTGILMDVHPGFSWEVDRLVPIRFSGSAGVNNLHGNDN